MRKDIVRYFTIIRYWYGTIYTAILRYRKLLTLGFVGFVPGFTGAGTHLVGDVISQTTVGGMGMGRGMYIETYQRRRGRRKGSF